MQTVTLPCYGGREGTKVFRRPVSAEEAIAYFERYRELWFVSIQGDARRCRSNGRVKRWKTDPNRLEQPVKYGLKECGRFDANELVNRVLIPVDMPAPTPHLAPSLSITVDSGLAPTIGG